MTTRIQYKVINKIKNLSDNYHKLSLLSYILSQSLSIKCEREKMTDKEFKAYIGSNNWLMDKLKGFDESL
jgi:hypothetical protein